MQSVSSRIWTRVAVSMSYDDNHYTMDTSFYQPGLDYSNSVNHNQLQMLSYSKYSL